MSYFNIVAFLMFGCMTTSVLAQRSHHTIDVDHQPRSYTLYMPTRSVPVTGYPVVFAFHGGGMQGRAMEHISQLDQQAERYHFLVVYPDGIDRHWNDGRATIRHPQQDVRFVSVLLTQLEHDYPVDTARVFATGLSNGALFTERLGCELSDKIAAIAPVAGPLPTKMLQQCHPTTPIAVLQMHGNADPIMPYGGGHVKDFHGRGEGGQVSSVVSTAAFWAAHNGCQATTQHDVLPVVTPTDPTRIERMTYRGCPVSAPVTVLTIIGGGHLWPGGAQPVRPRITGRPSDQLHASAVIVSFFMTLPRR